MPACASMVNSFSSTAAIFSSRAASSAAAASDAAARSRSKSSLCRVADASRSPILTPRSARLDRIASFSASSRRICVSSSERFATDRGDGPGSSFAWFRSGKAIGLDDISAIGLDDTRLMPLRGVDIPGGEERRVAFIHDVAAIAGASAPDLGRLTLGLWWQETSTDLRLATNAETASGDGTSALPSGGVSSFAEARTATGGDGVPRAAFFLLEEDDGARVVAAFAGETDFLRRAAASFTASLALARLSLSHC
mmetsp:Transcript_4923/g.20067  ORF Transcript_4923/g.20067 Transcript_4923/m.20067 type:complete len:253 (-) Transcript_4923:456-1214(-)